MRDLPTDYQQYIYTSRYSRFLDSEGRREYWPETVARYFDYFESDLDRHHGYKVSQGLRSELEDAVRSLHVMPSMRALMTAGEACDRENLAAFNCSFVPLDRPKSFAEILYILMCGTGVGFSVERQVIANLPPVPASFEKTGATIIVGDSKLGWAEAFEDVLKHLWAGKIPEIDYSLVRPAGERLKVFGGRASGPEPLRALFEFTIRTFRHAAGRRLNSLECHEIATKTGEIVVVGGVRRSAEISLSNLSDQRMRDAKSGQWWIEKPHLALSNNSVAYTEKPDVGAWMDEWSALYRSRSGERGIFNRAGAVQKMLRLGRRDHRYEFGTNPCVTGDTELLTRDGYFPIRDLVGKEVEIWNGKQWSKVTPFSTGLNPLVRVELSDGTGLTCTPYHNFLLDRTPFGQTDNRVKASHLTPGDRLQRFNMPVIPEFGAAEWVQECFESEWFNSEARRDGSIQLVFYDEMSVAKTGAKSIHQIRQWFTTVGVQAYISLNGDEPDTLTICPADVNHLLYVLGITLPLSVDDIKAPPVHGWRPAVFVKSVTDLDRVEETFCVNEPVNHTATFDGIVTGNCGEIVLRPRGLCNLTEAVIRESDTPAILKEKVRLAAILGTWQSTQTRYQFVDPEWHANAVEERLLGVSLTGIYDNALMRGDMGHPALASALTRLKEEVIRANRMESHEIGISPSVATTTVKPSGTVSQLVGSPSGIHQGHAEHYIRRVTGDNKDPVTRFMVDAGIPHEPHAAKPDQMTVFSFPVALGRGTVTRDDVTAIEHLELVRTYNNAWSEHAVSCTISVREHEWPAVGGWVYDHFDDLAGVSFLPHFEDDSSYAQMPYETISSGTYERMVEALPSDIDWSRLASYEAGQDTVTATREFACVGNTCEIVDAASPV